MAKSDVREVDDEGKVSKSKRRFDSRDEDTICDMICDEHATRKREREDREKIWDDIDRQIAMEPEATFKKMADGTADAREAWMAEL